MTAPTAPTAPRWVKSSFSADVSCVELATWRKSSFSGAGNDCVELATARDLVGVRDTKARAAGALVLPDAARTALLAFARR